MTTTSLVNVCACEECHPKIGDLINISGAECEVVLINGRLITYKGRIPNLKTDDELEAVFPGRKARFSINV